ncbi:unnamed protein product [Brassicogethes aeneus]|uniref:Uncharacterized protein n=1 Tax=Brassicogethes aeneus TaxID=1431903 RepID=A0A9P0FD03_BRAAE|nr:unnamed protein product [Brassicogethes aeneus]
MMAAINNLQETIKSLQSDIQALKRKDTEIMETIIQEMSDRQNRQNNLIFYNVVELQGGNTGNKQAADTENVINILGRIMPNNSIQNIRLVKRLGKSSSTGKPAPLKVEFETKDAVYAVLKNKYKLKEDNSPVQISTDKTAMERQHFKSILEELKQREENGDKDLFIKYINGNPTIAKSKK